jgi:hypothetical protein
MSAAGLLIKHKNSQISKNFLKNIKKHYKKWKKLKYLCYYFSNGIAKLNFFFEIRDQRVVNGLDMVLILKSETKVGGVCTGQKKFFFFLVLKEKSFAALRYAHKDIIFYLYCFKLQ